MTQTLSSFIDHSLLKPDATEGDIRQLCAEAQEYGFKAVCVAPCWVPLCKTLLEGSAVEICTVVGFPLGSALPQVKAAEAKVAVEVGATELDMVINIGALKSGDVGLVLEDIQAVCQAAPEVPVKVIIECCLLEEDEKVLACQMAKEAGAKFVKTSTGFSTHGATVEDVALMKQTVGDDMEIKAAGGIRSREDAQAMIEAGATRLGCSAGVKIVNGEQGGSSTY